MARRLGGWIETFLDYSSIGEAPRHMYFWVAVSTIAGALQRKVWFEQGHFRWYPNFYVVLVAPPGVVSKSTTASIGMNLLRAVPDIKFGPDVVTWPALVTAFSESAKAFQLGEEWHTMCAMTIESSEFGNLLNPKDTAMVDLLVSLWDGKQGAFEKKTKHSGCDTVENPWINLIACTTPAWIAGNFPEYMIGGGFTSRCVFVYADAKARLVAYPGQGIPSEFGLMKADLIHDLEWISQSIIGPYEIDPNALDWGYQWYEKHNKSKPANLDDDRFGGYLARKQSHIHKLAMVLAASATDERAITLENLTTANQMVTDLEPDMAFVFSRIGKSETSFYADRLISYIHKTGGQPYQDAYRYMHSNIPSMRDFEDVMSGCIRAGFLKLVQQGDSMWLLPGMPLPTAKNGGA